MASCIARKNSNSILLLFLLLSNSGFSQVFQLSFPSSVLKQAFSGNIYIFLSKNEQEPLWSSNFPVANPVIRVSVTNLQPDSIIKISEKNAVSYPVKITDLERGQYFVQAIFDLKKSFGTERSLYERAGNLFSPARQITLTHDLSKNYQILCKNIVREKVFTETSSTKEVKVLSGLLSRFHKKDIFISGTVVLPDTLLRNPAASLPLFINIGGFGENHFSLSENTLTAEKLTGQKDFICIFLDGNSSNGHTVYANSDNNGPWGDALVQEFLPVIEEKYHCNGYRYVHGHSSGGWASLYLQVMYPGFFQSCWASSPDSYDFRNFSGINLYKPGENVYYDSTGNLRPAALLGGVMPLCYVKPIAAWEAIVPGEQFNSFNAVFSAKLPNGTSRSLWDPVTGAIDKATVDEWKKYDLALYLKKNWNTLAPLLDGKILITVGESDNFLLDGASRSFKKDADELNMNIKVRFFSGDHFTVLTDQVNEIAGRELESSYEKWKEGKLTKASR